MAEVAARSPAGTRGAADAARSLVAEEGSRDGHLTKWLGTGAIDASLAACVAPFALYPSDSSIAVATVAEIDRQLAPAGVYRYRGAAAAA